jgi:hypothetical protein
MSLKVAGKPSLWKYQFITLAHSSLSRSSLLD